MRKISSIRVQNYLEENYVFPEYVIGDVAYYRKSKRFFEAYDKYYMILNLSKRRK